jgi:hypothetical protein
MPVTAEGGRGLNRRERPFVWAVDGISTSRSRAALEKDGRRPTKTVSDNQFPEACGEVVAMTVNRRDQCFPVEIFSAGFDFLTGRD